MECWELTYHARPWTVNSERGRAGRKGQGTSGHWSKRAALVRAWREAFKDLAEDQQIPHLPRLHIVVQQFCPDRRMPDTGACYGAVKAAIDGLRDAGVIDDDTGEFVPSILMLAPELDKDIGNALRLTIYKDVRDVGHWLSSAAPRLDSARMG